MTLKIQKLGARKCPRCVHFSTALGKTYFHSNKFIYNSRGNIGSIVFYQFMINLYRGSQRDPMPEMRRMKTL
jgi:hypothetical protein